MQNLNQNEQIKCPSCGSFIDISTALYAQIFINNIFIFLTLQNQMILI
nr:hypothetical protein [Campylobacter jejuni]